jgi:hypothetical protein
MTADVDRTVSPAGDHRDHPVPCTTCQRPTWAIDATCNRHADTPGAPARGMPT